MYIFIYRKKTIKDLLALKCALFWCVSVTFPYDVSGQEWYLMNRILVFALSLLLLRDLV